MVERHRMGVDDEDCELPGTHSAIAIMPYRQGKGTATCQRPVVFGCPGKTPLHAGMPPNPTSIANAVIRTGRVCIMYVLPVSQYTRVHAHLYNTTSALFPSQIQIAETNQAMVRASSSPPPRGCVCSCLCLDSMEPILVPLFRIPVARFRSWARP